MWVVSALFTELQEWYASGSAWYFTNPINTVELGSLFLVSAGVMLRNVGTLQNHAEQSEVAFGVVLMWIAVVLRLLSLTTTFGPLVLMFIKMIADAAKWLALMMAVILAFAAGKRDSVINGYDSLETIHSGAHHVFLPAPGSSGIREALFDAVFGL